MPARVVYRDEKRETGRKSLRDGRLPGASERGLPAGAQVQFPVHGCDRQHTLAVDNSPYHLDVGRHHRHTPDGDITKLEFTALPELIEDFQNEVTEIYEQRTD
jgi:hypothetical protein